MATELTEVHHRPRNLPCVNVASGVGRQLKGCEQHLVLSSEPGYGLVIVGGLICAHSVAASGHGDPVPSRVKQPVGSECGMQVVIEDAAGGRTPSLFVLGG